MAVGKASGRRTTARVTVDLEGVQACGINTNFYVGGIPAEDVDYTNVGRT